MTEGKDGSSTDPETEFARLTEELDGLKVQRGSLLERQRLTEEKRRELTEQLKQAGVDVNNLPSEKLRLQHEVSQAVQEAHRKISDFKAALQKHSGEPDLPETTMKEEMSEFS